MRLVRLATAAIVLLVAVNALAIEAVKPAPWKPSRPPGAPAPAESAAAPTRRLIIGGVADTGQFLPDTTVLYRVGPRRGTVRDFIEFWFGSSGLDRPEADSLGRVEFLENMINKDVIGLTALASNEPLRFEDRAVMREHTQRVLSNTLFRKLVADSVHVTEEQIRDYWQMTTYHQHFRHMVFAQKSDGEKARAELVARRLAWDAAKRRYAKAVADSLPDGDIGWVSAEQLDYDVATIVYPLKPGEYSPVFQDADGFQLVQSIERRPVQAPALNPMRRAIRHQLEAIESDKRTQTIRASIRQEIGVVYDSTNIRFLADRFASAGQGRRRPLRASLDLREIHPEILDPDTARVLATWKDGRITIRDVMAKYSSIATILRPDLSQFDAVLGQADGLLMEPYMAQQAVRLGFDKDPFAVWQIERKREELLVGHLFADSIGARVSVTRTDRRKYYEQNKTQYVTYPAVRWASFLRYSHASAESLANALESGLDAVALVREDSLAGRRISSIGYKRENTPSQYNSLLFEELRPRQTSIQGPDAKGNYMVMQLLEYEAPRQVTFEEAEQSIDESLQNIRAEAALKAMLARMRKQFVITSRPDLVMRIRLIDSTLDS